MSRRLRGALLLLGFALVAIVAVSSPGSVRAGDAGATTASPPRVGEVVFSDTVLRPARDCGPRRQVHAFENRLRPRRATVRNLEEGRYAPAKQCR